MWPHTDPASFQSASEAQRSKGVELLGCADQIRSVAAQVAGEQSGDAITGFCDACHRSAATCTRQADAYFGMSRVSEAVGGLLAGLREDLEDLDARAHAEIDEIMQAMFSGSLNPVLAQQRIAAVVAQARRDAAALSTKATAAISAQDDSSYLGDDATGPRAAGSESLSAPPEKCAPDSANGMSAGWRRGPAPKDAPRDSDSTKGGPWRREHNGGEDKSSGSKGTDSGDSSQSDIAGTGNRRPGEVPASHKEHDGAARTPSALSPPMSVPSLGSGDGGTPSSSSMPSAASAGLGSGGLNMPLTPAASTPAGLGGGGLPSQGLSSPGLGGSGLSGGGGPGPVASSSDFSRGLSAGLGGPAAPFAPPVSPPSSTAAGSAGPGGGLSSAPPPVAAAAGGTSAGGQPAAMGLMSSGSAVGASGVPAGPAGPLPPFGSDVPRTAASAPVAPATGPPAVSASPGSSSSGGTGGVSLPPGVVGSGVGASAGVANEAVRSSEPDPLLVRASELVDQLLRASAVHGLFLDWCVGVFLTRSGAETVITSSEGAGFIPRGVFVPRSARMLFSEPGLPGGFRSRWFSWANPAETMLAFAEWAAEGSGVDLWALAVSTEYGGSAAPARSAGVAHFEECSTKPSPSGAVEPMHLDEGHIHRLETIDRGEYARLTGFGRDGRMPDRSEAWMTTVAAAQTALGRAGMVPDLAVPPIIREVLELLSSGVQVPAGRWQTLRAEAVQLMSTGSGLRPGWLPGDTTAASPYVRACHDVARLAELLLLWDLDNDADGPDIKHPEIAYLARQIDDSAVGQQERE